MTSQSASQPLRLSQVVRLLSRVHLPPYSNPIQTDGEISFPLFVIGVASNDDSLIPCDMGSQKGHRLYDSRLSLTQTEGCENLSIPSKS